MTRALVLLVGTNPLPNWVCWRYLSRERDPFQFLVLVSSATPHGGGTRDMAARLVREIQKDCESNGVSPPQVRHVALKDPGDGREIRDRLVQATSGLDYVHLNYTGGTKPMAVHSYQALLSRGQDVEFSYLDSRCYSLRPSIGQPSPDLRSDCLDMDQLFRLHGIDIDDPGQEKPLWLDTARRLLDKAVDNPGKMANWLKKVGERDEERDQKRSARSIGPVPWPNWCPYLGQTFSEDSGLQMIDALDLRRGVSDDVAKKVQAFFIGGWLESVILDSVQRTGLSTTARMSVKCRRPPAGRGMELDVVALRGYQLFLFSCSRSLQNAPLKKRGFEAVHRAAQLGGEEARAALVTVLPGNAPTPAAGKDPWPNVFDLQADIDTDLGGVYSVKVLGRRDLRDPVRAVTQVLEDRP